MLVVDDSKAIRQLMATFLARLGYENVRFAGGVKEALREFEEQRSEVVFLDVLLDQEDGGEFAQLALDAKPLTTIVLMTALGPNDDEVVKLVSHGARHLLPKPVQLSTLRTVLERIQEARDEEERATEPRTHQEPDASYG
jgi:DNA-binding NtrC family response regulator